jgi:DNA-binding transcriptional ArsR family regulator
MSGSQPKTKDLFNALGHAMRRQILRAMLGTQEEVSPRELSAKLSQQLTAISYHVGVLDECNAIELVRTEKIRGSTQHFYRVIVKEDWALAALKANER